MKRRVIKQGNNTLTITLPRKWCDSFGVKAGDELELAGSRNNLIITAGGSAPKSSEVALVFDKEDDFNINNLSALYTIGIDTLNITYPSTAVYEKMVSRLDNLSGYEIVRQSKNQCTIHSIANLDEMEFKPMLRRAFLVTLDMARDVGTSLSKHDYEHLRGIRNLERTTNRLTDTCKRLLAKGKAGEYNTAVTNTLLCMLEMIGDQYKFICDTYVSRDLKISKDAIKLYDETTELLEEFHTAFFDMGPKKFAAVYNHGRAVHARAVDMFNKKPSEDVYLLRHIISITNILYELNITIFQIYLCMQESNAKGLRIDSV